MTTDTVGDLDRPLAGLTVLDFSQFLAGPVAALRLADLGARVIKIERPVVGELGRTLAFAGREEDGDTLSFHAMNRNKLSVAADLKAEEGLELVKQLAETADVVIENFRPGVMQRLGLDYETLRQLNPRLVYASVSGYGVEGPWKDRPGQDLLAQAVSGLPWLNGTRADPPIAIGISVADHLASSQLALGITSLLLRRERTGTGGRVETSLLEVTLDLQFELLTVYFSQPGLTMTRGGRYSAHPYLGAPYGIYPTSDGYLAIAMNPVPMLGALLGLPELEKYDDPEVWLARRDEIAGLLGQHLSTQTTRHWLGVLEPADVWCAEVLTLEALAETDAFAAIDMLQEIERPERDGEGTSSVWTTRLPIRIDGTALRSRAGAPRIGEHTDEIRLELGAHRR